MDTKGQIISRLRVSLKETSSDSNYSNRFLWNEFFSCAKVLIKRDADSQRRIYKTNEIWDTICLSMDEVSPILCDCISVPMDCSIYKSTFKIPKGLESALGFLYRYLSTPDNSIQFTIVTPNEFQVKTKIRYNRGKYAFFHNGYLWTDKSYPKLILSGIFEDSVNHLKCSSDNITDNVTGCFSQLKQPCKVPDYLQRPSIEMVLQGLLPTLSRPQDNIINTSESQREVSL